MSNRVDVQDALNVLYRASNSPEAVRIVRNYIEDLEQRARNVVQDADDAQRMHAAQGSAGRVTWQSLNALRATINYPRP